MSILVPCSLCRRPRTVKRPPTGLAPCDGCRSACAKLARGPRACGFCSVPFWPSKTDAVCCSMLCANRKRMSIMLTSTCSRCGGEWQQSKFAHDIGYSRCVKCQTVERPRRQAQMRRNKAPQISLTDRKHVIATQTHCAICTKPVDKTLRFPDPQSPSIDHIKAVAVGGTSERDNLQLTHLTCNCAKGDGVHKSGHWSQHITLKPKTCAQCWNTYTPNCGAQKRCDPCRFPTCECGSNRKPRSKHCAWCIQIRHIKRRMNRYKACPNCDVMTTTKGSRTMCIPCQMNANKHNRTREADEPAHIEQVHAMRTKGMSFKQIAQQLDRQGFRTHMNRKPTSSNVCGTYRYWRE